MLSLWAVSAIASIAMATTLTDVCTTTAVQAALPADDYITGITFDPSSVTTALTYNVTVSDEDNYP